MKQAFEDRFWSKVNKTEGCWEWMAGKNQLGYGRFSVNGPMVVAHRVAWESVNGQVPKGRELDHLCYNRGCVKPSHLRLVTRKQNNENHAGANRDSKSGIRGVSWYARYGKWVVKVIHNGKQHHGGYFSHIAQAERAAIALRNQLFTHNEMDRKAS